MKQVLINHLWQHKLTLKAALPFDSSSTTKYVDAQESLQYGLEDLRLRISEKKKNSK